MKTYNIELENIDSNFRNIISPYFEKLYSGRMKYKINQEDRQCQIRIPLGEIDLTNLSYVLAHFIIQKQEVNSIQRLLKNKYTTLTSPERKSIFNTIKENLSSNEEILDKLMQQQRKLHLSNSIAKYLSVYDKINIQGYIRFRLADYKRELEEYVDSKVELFLADKEYNEFIDLLKVFVETRPYHTSLVHVLFQPAGTFTLLDESQKPYLLQDGTEKLLKDQSCEILTGTLVELLPAKIILHRSELYCNHELMSILSTIFSKQVKTCRGCSICLQ